VALVVPCMVGHVIDQCDVKLNWSQFSSLPFRHVIEAEIIDIQILYS